MNTTYNSAFKIGRVARVGNVKNYQANCREMADLAHKIQVNLHLMHEWILNLRLAELESWTLPVDIEDFEKLQSMNPKLK